MKTKLTTISRTALCAALIVSAGLTGCETPGQTALLGAATGAAIGGASRGRGEDALKGAAIGAGAGYVAGKVVQHQRRRAYAQGYSDREYGDGYYDRRGYRHRY